MTSAWISLIVFFICYLFFILLPTRRSLTACTGGLLLILATSLTWQEALREKISWNIMGVLVGTLVLAELFLLSRVWE